MPDFEEKIISEAWSHDQITRNFQTLCLRYRGRFSGSEQGLAAGNFIEQTLKEYGLSQVHKQVFTKTNWQRGELVFEMIEPVQLSLPAIALPYAPACSAEFELIDCGMGMPEQIRAVGEKIRGKAVLIDDSNPSDGPKLHRLQKYVNVLEAGAAAFLFAHGNEGMLAPTGSLAFHHDRDINQALPSLGIAREIGQELRYWLEQGPVRIRLQMTNTLEPGQDWNIVGDIPGKQTDNSPYLIIGGHYDGHDIAHAAFDNATGTVVVMEVARILAQNPDRLERSIRFVLFSGEEMGLIGSHYYVKHKKHELDTILFVLNLDCVGAASDPVLCLQNAPEWEPILKNCIQHIGAPIQIENHLVPFSDHFPFVLHGVPGAFCYTPMSTGRGWGHTIADTFEKVSMPILQRMAMYMSRIMYRLANSQELPRQRKTAGHVLQSIKDFHLEQMMRYEGHWPF
ncbi:M28 family peptidase [bacterium]|nr:M28 family peptidase [bacterium]